jgi:hypothetical protein
LLVAVFYFQAYGQQPVATQPEVEQKPAAAPTVDYLQSAAQSSIFIYEGNTQPCDLQAQGPQQPAPLGSGFVVGISDASAKPEKWSGWRFLITARHVVKATNGAVVLRLNQSSEGEPAKCLPIVLKYGGEGQNVFVLRDEEGADVAAVFLTDVPGTSPTIFGASMLLDSEGMKKNEVKVGTNVFTVGYFYGYAGVKQNYPITKFGKISILTSEKWFYNPAWQRKEEAYVMDLQNTPGLSGAPVMTYGVEFHLKPMFEYRELPPYVVGIVKGLELAPVPTQAGTFAISQGITAVEPAYHIRMLLDLIVRQIKEGGWHPVLD